MTDIVIPLGNESSWNDGELRYALRSISQHLLGYGKVFIAGKPRAWLRNVIYIDAEDRKDDRKQFNIFSKMLKAAKDERVSDPFCMWHDDHFLLKVLSITDIKYWKWSDLKQLGILSQGTYQRTVLNCNKFLQEKEWSNTNFDIHVPILFEKEKFKTLEQEDWTREHILKSLYCNKFRIKGEDFKDLKIGAPKRPDEIKNIIKDRLFFSFSPGSLNASMKKVLQELFPNRSDFEHYVPPFSIGCNGEQIDLEGYRLPNKKIETII